MGDIILWGVGTLLLLLGVVGGAAASSMGHERGEDTDHGALVLAFCFAVAGALLWRLA